MNLRKFMIFIGLMVLNGLYGCGSETKTYRGYNSAGKLVEVEVKDRLACTTVYTGFMAACACAGGTSLSCPPSFDLCSVKADESVIGVDGLTCINTLDGYVEPSR